MRNFQPMRINLLGSGIIGIFLAAIAFMVAMAVFDNPGGRKATPPEKPARPFTRTTPPARPDYSRRAAWVFWDEADFHEARRTDETGDPGDPGTAARADIFVIHRPSSLQSDPWNAAFDDPVAQRALIDDIAPQDLTAFGRTGAIFMPLYRQPGAYARASSDEQSLSARALAIADIDRAFSYFLKRRDGDRPFIILGFGHGADLAAGLFQDRFSPRRSGASMLRSRLVAAYLIDDRLPRATISEALGMCAQPDETGCIISVPPLAAEADAATTARSAPSSAIVWLPGLQQDVRTVSDFACTPPALWLTQSEPASTQDQGAAPAPPHIACKNGFLRVSDDTATAPTPAPAPTDDHAAENPFHSDLMHQWGRWLAINAGNRLARHDKERAERARRRDRSLPDITESLDVIDSPINKVPQ